MSVSTTKKAKRGTGTVKRTQSTAKNKAGISSYNKFKDYKGRFYTGMKVGRSHKWNYDPGVWRDTKVTPDRWEITYNVVKRRAGHAPEGSGVPVGTGYHWFILAHQYVEKLNADDYRTSMIGLKFKLAHRRADKGKWNVTDKTQRKNLISILKDFIKELEENPEKTMPVPLEFEYRKKAYNGVAIPVMSSCAEGVCRQLDVTLNNEHLGIIRNTEKGWKMTGGKQGLTNAIGEIVQGWYE